MAVLLIGAVGGPNFGDELILESWIMEFLSRGYELKQIYVDGYGIDNLSTWLGNVYDGAYVLDREISLWQNLWLLDGEELERECWTAVIENLKSNVEFLDFINRLATWFAEKEINQIHFVGGGYINSVWKRNYGLLIFSSVLSIISGSKITLSGQGFFPISTEGRSLLTALSLFFSFIDVRDVTSYRTLKDDLSKCNVLSFSPDDIFLGLFRKEFVSNYDSPALIICLQNDLYEGTKYLESLKSPRLISSLKKMNITQVLFVKAMDGDVDGFDDEFKLLLQENGVLTKVIEPYQLLQNGFPYNASSFVITTRYHIHFLGFLCGLAGAIISSGEYYELKHNEIIKLGSKWKWIDANAITTENFMNTISSLSKMKIDPQFKARLLEKKMDAAESVFSCTEGDRLAVHNLKKLIIDLAVCARLHSSNTLFDRQFNVSNSRYKSLVSSIKFLLLHRRLMFIRKIARDIYKRF